MNRLIVSFMFLIFAQFLLPIDITGFGGIKTDDSKKLYGIAVAWDFIPFIQIEMEGFRLKDSSYNFISANPLLYLDLASISPYISVGFGFSGEKSDISTYKSYKNYGGGIKIFLGMVGIRIDYRVIKDSKGNWKRIYGGLDLSL